MSPRPIDDVLPVTVELERTLPVPPSQVWSAYADLAERVRWVVPDGEEIAYDDDAFAVGGVDRYRCGPPGDLSNHVTVRYLAVDPPAGFAMLEEVERDGATVSLALHRWRLSPAGAGTDLRVVVHALSLAGEPMADGIRRGHDLVLDNLVRHLAG